jgi:hypothetical protein
MAEIVLEDVDRKPDPSFGASPFDYPGDAHSPKKCTTFIDEDISRLVRQPPEPPQLISFDTFLMTICPSREIDVIPAQIASLASSQTMAMIIRPMS